MNQLKRTPLHEVHKSLGAKMVPFAGFEMPVSYAGIIEEHECVRERVGLFDVSHMGEFIVTGPDTWAWLNRMVTNDCTRLEDGGVLYTALCREDGTVVDDLLVSRVSPGRGMIVANAANIEKDFAHLSERLSGDVQLVDASDRYALVAVQGPRSRDLLLRCPTFEAASETIGSIGYYRQFALPGEEEITVSRTGYTGELGFELFVPPARAEALWDELTREGAQLGVRPVGLAARDTLRFEASFCLYGHELDDETTPIEAGLKWVVRLKKGDFVGRDALVRELDAGSRKRLVGLELEGRNIARQGYDVTLGDNVVGTVTSGTFSPTLKKSLCMAFVQAGEAGRADEGGFAVRVRQKEIPAARVHLPFYPSRAAGRAAGRAK
jgi:aminomethyltransferase